MLPAKTRRRTRRTRNAKRSREGTNRPKSKRERERRGSETITSLNGLHLSHRFFSRYFYTTHPVFRSPVNSEKAVSLDTSRGPLESRSPHFVSFVFLFLSSSYQRARSYAKYDLPDRQLAFYPIDNSLGKWRMFSFLFSLFFFLKINRC